MIKVRESKASTPLVHGRPDLEERVALDALDEGDIGRPRARDDATHPVLLHEGN